MHDVLRHFKSKRILVVGDVMLDRFVYGNVHRWSPEYATCPVMSVSSEVYRLGGAANVAANLVDMGAEVVYLAGIIGMDPSGNKLLELLGSKGITSKLVTSCERRTTVKTRYVADQRHLLRLDEEDTSPDYQASAEICRAVSGIFPLDGIIIQDYAKGVVTNVTVQHTLKYAKDRGMLTFVDPKSDYWDLFAGATLVKPNLEEARAAVGVMSDAAHYAPAVRKLTEAEAVVVTMGSRGMHASTKFSEITREPKPVNAVDVSGAGDTSIAALALSKVSGASWSEALDIANAAAGIAVGKAGTATASLDELYEFFK